MFHIDVFLLMIVSYLISVFLIVIFVFVYLLLIRSVQEVASVFLTKFVVPRSVLCVILKAWLQKEHLSLKFVLNSFHSQIIIFCSSFLVVRSGFCPGSKRIAFYFVYSRQKLALVEAVFLILFSVRRFVRIT